VTWTASPGLLGGICKYFMHRILRVSFRQLESSTETQPQLQPALLRLSAMISQSFIRLLVIETTTDDSKHHAGNNNSPRNDEAIGFAIAAAQPVFLIGSRSRCAATVFVGLGPG
jgi:hypothetical protein